MAEATVTKEAAPVDSDELDIVLASNVTDAERKGSHVSDEAFSKEKNQNQTVNKKSTDTRIKLEHELRCSVDRLQNREGLHFCNGNSCLNGAVYAWMRGTWNRGDSSLAKGKEEETGLLPALLNMIVNTLIDERQEVVYLFVRNALESSDYLGRSLTPKEKEIVAGCLQERLREFSQ